jgi:hypothetical protein
LYICNTGQTKPSLPQQQCTVWGEFNGVSYLFEFGWGTECSTGIKPTYKLGLQLCPNNSVLKCSERSCLAIKSSHFEVWFLGEDGPGSAFQKPTGVRGSWWGVCLYEMDLMYTWTILLLKPRFIKI